MVDHLLNCFKTIYYVYLVTDIVTDKIHATSPFCCGVAHYCHQNQNTGLLINLRQCWNLYATFWTAKSSTIRDFLDTGDLIYFYWFSTGTWMADLVFLNLLEC